MSHLQDVLRFWFGEIRETPEYLKERNAIWFGGKPEVDEAIRSRFSHLFADQELRTTWPVHAVGRLAAIVVLDQFSRNIFRGTAQAFAHDAEALLLCRLGLDLNMDKVLHPIQRLFFYLPLEHSESLEVQELSISCFARLLSEASGALKANFEDNMTYAVRHYEIIKRFGRFPHRNRALGRVSTPDEEEFLTEPNSSF